MTAKLKMYLFQETETEIENNFKRIVQRHRYFRLSLFALIMAITVKYSNKVQPTIEHNEITIIMFPDSKRKSNSNLVLTHHYDAYNIMYVICSRITKEKSY